MPIFKTKDYCTFWIEDIDKNVIWTGIENYCLFNGDTVCLENEKPVLVERTSNIKNIVGILQTSSKIRHGIDKRGHIIYIFRPIDNAMPEFLVASKLNNQLQNHWCLVDYLDWENVSKRPRGSIVSDLGFVGDYCVERTALYKHYRKISIDHHTIKTSYEKELQGIIGYYESGNWKLNRTSLTHIDTYSIDPAGCKDIDDAFSIDANTLYIHISDLTPWIKSGSLIDTLAQKYCSTLYGEETNFPMLPRELSENICSLVKDKERAAITLMIEFKDNKIIRQDLFQSIIINRNVLDYDNCNKTVDNCNKILDQGRVYAKVLGEILRLNLEIDSHTMIEIFMVYYNMYIARLERCELYRIQEKKIELYPDRLSFMNLESAVYSFENKGHYCLGIDCYTHATSPIRRYADIIVQRMLVIDYIIDKSLIQKMNTIQKSDKRFYRDLAFLQAIYKGDRIVEAIVLSSNYIYIQNWRQRVRYPNSYELYSKISLEFYVDPNPIQWKKKIVFSK
jgi:exoribonuclease R